MPEFVKSTRSWHIATEIRDDGYALTQCHRQVKATKVTDDLEVTLDSRAWWPKCLECGWREVCRCFRDGTGQVYVPEDCPAHGQHSR